MDSFVRVLQASQRPQDPCAIGWIGAWQQRRHSTTRYCEHVYFMWITKGSGFLDVDGQRFAIQAPCLICTRPETNIHYQPDDCWDEYFAIAEPRAVQLLPAAMKQQPVRPLAPSVTLQSLLASWTDVNFAVPGDEARINALISFAFLESLRCEVVEPDPLLAQIQTIRQAIDTNPAMIIDPQNDAQAAGVSRSTWERAWKNTVGIPPARYHLQRRLEIAARLLEAEPGRSITDIAGSVGYQDPLHFSRQFRKWCGSSPKQYRLSRNQA